VRAFGQCIEKSTHIWITALLKVWQRSLKDMTWRCGRILQERHSEGLKVKKNSGVEILKKHENKLP
jgi:hypothetical protein